ncbi:uncharacterized protein METZ01_LOCUS260692, partial [marine metagenome]
VEPSEAIHSDLILPLIPKYFDVIYQRNLNGGIAYQILHNNIDEFEDTDDLESVKWLDYLLRYDVKLTEEDKVPVLFWYGVCKSKTKY